MDRTRTAAFPMMECARTRIAEGNVIAGRYKLERKLGQGGFGSVWAASDEVTGEEVAVKLLSLSGEREIARFRDEVALLRLLNLPGVVRLLDDGMEGGIPFLVTELVTGREFPGPGLAIPAEWDEIAPVVETLLETLARVHANDVVHRDLKPANVLVTDDGRPIVLDFGVSWGPGFTEDEGENTVAGTPAYLAPEQAVGRRGDERTDLYTLGVMLYEVLSGRLPHRARSMSELVRQKLDEKPRPLAVVAPEVPQRVAVVVDQLLNTLPTSRPDSAATVLELLGRRDARRTLPRLGGSELLDEVVARLASGRSVDVFGPAGSGRTRLATDTAAALRDAGHEVVEARIGTRPFASLGTPWNRVALELPERERVTAIAAALNEAGAIVVADDGEDLDSATLAVFAEAGPAVPVLTITGDAGSADLRIPRLQESDLRELFHGPDIVLHLIEDGARELARRTDGRPSTVLNVLDAWERAGLCYWEDGKIRIDRPALDRLAAGLQVHSRRGEALVHDIPTRQAIDVAEWVRLAGDAATAELVVTASGLDGAAVSQAVDELKRAGVVRSEEGKLLLLDTLPREQRWEPGKMRKAHERLAEAMEPGTPGRFTHLLRVGDPEAAIDEALAIGEQAAITGRWHAAVVLLLEALELARRTKNADRIDQVLTHLAIASLSTHSSRTLDLTLYRVARAGTSAHADHVRELLSTAKLVRFVEQSATRGMDACRAIAPFEHVELERWRRALIFGCSYALTPDEHLAISNADVAWAATTGSFECELAVADWRGLVYYRLGDYAASAAAHGRARRGTKSRYRFVAAGLNEAKALIETGDTDEAARVARAAADVAAEIRVPGLELRGRWAERVARYRGGEDLAPSLELIEAAGSTGSASHVMLVYMAEAVNAWRTGDFTVGRQLAGRVVPLARRRSMRVEAALALSIERACGGSADPDEVAALLATGAGPRNVRAQVEILTWPHRPRPVLEPFASHRLDILSEPEACGAHPLPQFAVEPTNSEVIQ